MHFGTLVEIVSALHLSPMVFGQAGEERGGLMFVAPPGHLKTTAIETLEQFPRTQLVSNITNGKLTDLRESFIAGDIKTLGFPDYDMIYKRHGSVASQIEGTLMALCGEGFRNPAFCDQRVSVIKSRCTIIAGCTFKCYEEKLQGWLDSGFARRFLWSKFRVKNPEAMENALLEFKRAQLDGDFILKIPGKPIPWNLSKTITAKILHQLRYQPDRRLPFVLAQRIVCVLKWKHGEDTGLEYWNDFAPSLAKDGTEIEIEEETGL